MPNSFKCFLIEPIYGGSLPEPSSDRDWPPYKYIVGWHRPDTGETQQHNSGFRVGAMWRATWQPRNWDWDNETEPHILVRCPNSDDGLECRDWDIDSRASNCGSPKDKSHRCWVRHGEAPILTVDKAGRTCTAGAGSIQLPKWHGFLKNGILSTDGRISL